MTGSLAVWRLPPGAEEDAGGGGDGGDEGEDGEELVETRWWGEAGVMRWLRENVTRVPGAYHPRRHPHATDKETVQRQNMVIKHYYAHACRCHSATLLYKVCPCTVYLLVCESTRYTL